MDHTLEVLKSISIDASIENLWEAMTNPVHIAKYLHGTETITDWKQGSEIIFQGKYDGQKYKDKGIVQSNVYLKELSYLYFTNFSGLEDKPENYSLVKYIFAEENGKTTFTWHQKGYPDASRQKHAKGGMETMLKHIKAISESL